MKLQLVPEIMGSEVSAYVHEITDGELTKVGNSKSREAIAGKMKVVIVNREADSNTPQSNELVYRDCCEPAMRWGPGTRFHGGRRGP
jgi:hypothetical protein